MKKRLLEFGYSKSEKLIYIKCSQCGHYYYATKKQLLEILAKIQEEPISTKKESIKWISGKYRE